MCVFKGDFLGHLQPNLIQKIFENLSALRKFIGKIIVDSFMTHNSQWPSFHITQYLLTETESNAKLGYDKGLSFIRKIL